MGSGHAFCLREGAGLYGGVKMKLHRQKARPDPVLLAVLLVTLCFSETIHPDPLEFDDAASSCYRGARTTPRTGLQPARFTAVTANGQRELLCDNNSRWPLNAYEKPFFRL